MKKRSVIATLAVLGVSAASAWLAAQGTQVTPLNNVSAFVNVNAVPMDSDRVLPDWTVVVGDGKVVSMGPSSAVKPPAGARIIDGRGKYLMPGLAEMHGHLPPPATSAPGLVDSVLFLYVANGVTTVRGMQGAPGQIELRARAARGEIVSPTLFLAGPAFSGGTVKSVEDAAARVKTQKEEGWDLLKVQGGLTIETYDAMAKAARELHIPFAGHVPPAVGVEHALAAGQETIDHIDMYAENLGGADKPIPDAAIRDLVQKTVRSGTWIVPTLYVWETLRGPVTLESRTSLPELKYLPRQQIEQWTNALANRLKNPNFNAEAARHYIDNRMRIMKALADAGARILLGSDAPQQFNVPGFSIHREMQRMVDAGMTPYQVLRTGTADVGRHYRSRGDFGNIAIGHRADFILLTANPLTDVANVQLRDGVMLRGRWMPEAEIQKRLAQIAADFSK
ncbi:MAG: amidohydrolase family protein [Acidobacteria bacterium]|nr:amidohydrolase family protein [Acidobacteriota bacterium]